MFLCDFPVEILERILSHLDVFDILSFSECSKKFYQLCSNDRFWRLLAKSDYNMELKTENQPFTNCDSSYPTKQFFLKVLLPLGPFLFKSMALCDNHPYGGLVKIIYHDWSLHVVILHPPSSPNTHFPLQPELLFSIGFDSSISKIRWKFDLGWFFLENFAKSEKGSEIVLRIRKQRNESTKFQGIKPSITEYNDANSAQKKLLDLHAGNLIVINHTSPSRKINKNEAVLR